MSACIYTDGACGKNGVGGWAWLLVNDDRLITGGLGRTTETTNQRMEVVAAIEALNFYPESWDVEIVSDSAYLVNCMNDRWYDKWRTGGWLNSKKELVANQDIWIFLLSALELRTGTTTWTHVKGHNGDRWNEKCDELAVFARTAP